MKKQSFFKGTVILIAANAISKILGAVFKIPLTYILQEEGMAIFNTAMGVYSMVLSFIISGLPPALSRYVAEEYTLKNYSTVKRTVKLSTVIFCLLGILGTVLLYFFSDFFAYSMKDPKAALAIRVISPSVFFVAWGTVYKSYYQGCVNMIPTALSQVIEAFIRLSAGFFGAYLLRNSLLEISSAGAISGITIGEIIATLILFALFIPTNRNMPYIGEKKSRRSICNSLASIAVPMLVCSCISGMLNLLDVAMIRNSLIKIQFTPQTAEMFLLKYSSYTSCFDDLKERLMLTIDGARWLYGAYSGYALTIFHLPTGIIGALGISVLPVITGALTKNDKVLVQKTAVMALKLTLIIAIPCSLALYLFSEPILELLFSNSASAGLLQQLSPCVIFICVSQLFMVILHGAGRVIEPFLYSLIGIGIKLISNYFLVRNPAFNISGAVLGSDIGFFVVMILNGISVKRHLKIDLKLLECVVKPTCATAVMGLLMLLLYKPMNVIFLNSQIALAICVFVGGIGYLLSLMSMNVLNKKELKEIHL